jgi:hypothetical protein
MVFTGVPELVVQKWQALKQILQHEHAAAPFHSKVGNLSFATAPHCNHGSHECMACACVYLVQVFRLALSAYDETLIAAALGRVQGAVSPHGEVSIGSYPVTGMSHIHLLEVGVPSTMRDMSPDARPLPLHKCRPRRWSRCCGKLKGGEGGHRLYCKAELPRRHSLQQASKGAHVWPQHRGQVGAMLAPACLPAQVTLDSKEVTLLRSASNLVGGCPGFTWLFLS